MPRDPLRESQPLQPGEQRGKHDAQENEDRGAAGLDGESGGVADAPDERSPERKEHRR